jgi:hypothetical protein
MVESKDTLCKYPECTSLHTTCLYANTEMHYCDDFDPCFFLCEKHHTLYEFISEVMRRVLLGGLRARP